jgi:hypothetical protein
VEAVETIDDLKYERKKSAVKGGLEGVSDEEAFAEIQARRLGSTKTDKPVFSAIRNQGRCLKPTLLSGERQETMYWY